VKIPKEHHRFILGPKGKRLTELELVTSTKISVPRQDDVTDVITITGTKEGIERARHEIQEISDEQVCFFLSDFLETRIQFCCHRKRSSMLYYPQ